MRCDPVNHPSSASKPRRSSDKSSRASPRPSDSKAHGRKSNHTTGGTTLRDIAKELGISHVTVSLALRDAPGVSEALRRQILTVAGNMGYRPNADAAALGRRRSAATAQQTATVLAWINPGREPLQPDRSKELALYWQGACDAAKQYGSVLEEFDGTTHRALEYANETLKARNLTGILVPFHSLIPKYWETFPWQDYTVVHLDSSIVRAGFLSVASDYFRNCLLACEKIRALGYPRV